MGEEGAKLEAELTALGEEYGINIIGPNSLGITDSHTPLNGSFSQMMPPTGNMAFISQSGAMMVAIIDWSVTSGIGFSKVISLGNKAGVSEIELLQYLAEDDETNVIICYLESISDDDDFVRTMRETAHKKPIIVLKSGSSSAGAAAESSQQEHWRAVTLHSIQHSTNQESCVWKLWLNSSTSVWHSQKHHFQKEIT